MPGPATPGVPGVPCPPPQYTHTHTHTFLCSKKKKGRQREKRKGFKAETIKRLSPRSKCYCFNHSRASRIQKFFLLVNHGGRQYISVFHGLPTLKSISPALDALQQLSQRDDTIITKLTRKKK